MKILILGYYFSNNLGDPLLCECVRTRLAADFPEAEIQLLDFWGRKEFPRDEKVSFEEFQERYRKRRLSGSLSRHTPVDYEYRRQMRVLDAMRPAMQEICGTSCDVVVIPGGQMFMDWFSPTLSFYIREFSKRGIPVLLNACGTGPVFSRKLRREFSEALMDPMVKFISCRDHAEEVQAGYLSGGKRVYSVSDPALWADTVWPQDPCRRKNGVIGLGMMMPYNLPYKTLADFWQGLIRYLDGKQVPWKISVNGGSMDVRLAEKVLGEMPEYAGRERDCFLKVPESPAELAEEIASLRGLISFRLHSHILAAVFGVPQIALVWDDKLNEFFEKAGYPERALMPDASPETVWRAFEKAEQEGTDREPLVRQREESGRLLAQAVREALA